VWACTAYILVSEPFFLLFLVYPFYDVKEEEVPNKVKKGMQAFIDPRYKERSYAESKLTEIIPLCWTYDPTNRIDIFQLVELLRVAVMDDQRAANKKQNE
jgi:aspartyl/asparaginyl beta-hydroxylase (cupin superfamily)